MRGAHDVVPLLGQRDDDGFGSRKSSCNCRATVVSAPSRSAASANGVDAITIGASSSAASTHCDVCSAATKRTTSEGCAAGAAAAAAGRSRMSSALLRLEGGRRP